MTELPLQGEGLAVERIAEIRARHWPDNEAAASTGYVHCVACCQTYPCDAAQLLAALQAEPSPETVERVAEGSCPICERLGVPCGQHTAFRGDRGSRIAPEEGP